MEEMCFAFVLFFTTSRRACFVPLPRFAHLVLLLRHGCLLSITAKITTAFTSHGRFVSSGRRRQIFTPLNFLQIGDRLTSVTVAGVASFLGDQSAGGNRPTAVTEPRFGLFTQRSLIKSVVMMHDGITGSDH